MRCVADDLVGQTVLGKLRVIRRLGGGGAGEVFEVEHTLTRHRRALKVLRPELRLSSSAVARLVREAAAASRVDRPCVAQTFDAGRLEDGRAYVLMELVEGKTLREELAARGRFEEPDAVDLAFAIADALETIHAAGLIHRDVKPENVMLGEESGASARVTILDFGVCKVLSDPDGAEALTAETAIAGTPAYMAPEQLDASATVDARVDQWGLGVVLYELLAGARPFAGKTAAALAGALHERGAPDVRERAPATSEATSAVVARLLERDPARRFPAMIDACQALRRRSEELRGEGGELVGTVVSGRYRLTRTLGAGAAATVFAARDRETDRDVALKLFNRASSAKPSFLERIGREAKVAHAIDATHVPTVLDKGQDAALERAYLVLELCEGATLASHIERVGPLDAETALAVLEPLARALDAVHARGIVHRDVKPANVLVSTGPPISIKLLDFGIATVVGQDAHGVTSSGVLLGTPLFMAPEQARTDLEVTSAADRYALGQLAHYVLTGEAYFQRHARRGLLPLLAAIGRGVQADASAPQADRAASLPRAFDGWLARACALDPGARFASAREQIDALRAALAPVARAEKRWRGVAALIAILAAGGVALAASSGPSRTAEDTVAAAVEEGERLATTEPPTSGPMALPTTRSSAAAPASATAPPAIAATPSATAPPVKRPRSPTASPSSAPVAPAASSGPQKRPDSIF